MKYRLLFLLILSGNLAFSQLNESFNDGDLTSVPAWNGSSSGSGFAVVSQQLRSNSTTASSNFYLSTANTIAQNCQWEFWLNLQFNTSGANYVDVYLTADQADLQSGPVNGYFVRLGNTSDEISLYKRSGASASSTKLIDGTDGILNKSNNNVRVRITRTASNLFTLERDITGLGSSYVTEGSFEDSSFTTSAYFGILVQQSSSSFHKKHFFDDITISPLVIDTTPPGLVSATVIDSTSLEIVFNEAVDSVSARLVTNYTLNNSYGNPLSVKTTAHASKYMLTLAKGLNTASYLLTASGIADKTGNISSSSTAIFSYTKPFIAGKGDIVINEIFADPSPQIDLPSVEFVEIVNTKTHSIALQSWKYADPLSAATLPSDTIKPGEHLILCAKADTNEFKRFGKTIGISPWPSLNNSGDAIRLISPEGYTIDSVAYADSWYSTSAKKAGGWSLERINASSTCKGMFNWTASTDNSGGTPGKQNSVFIANFDQLAFKADSIKKLSDSTITVYFNKPADLATHVNAFTLTPALAIKSIAFDAYARQVTVVYNTRFPANTSHNFSISQLRDCAGNTVSTDSLRFTTPKLPPVRVDTAKLYITEIFADPSPEVNLPLMEFVEIFNPGKDTVDLDGWTLNNSKTKVSLKSASILPNQYLVLCPIGDTAQFAVSVRTAGLSTWPALTNAADQITLKSFGGRIVDSLAYSADWHSSTAKKQGGWSLERMDHQSVCTGRFNWTSSHDTNGGTPGRKNSVFISDLDKSAFLADSLKHLSDSTVIVYFSKSVDTATAGGAFLLGPANGSIVSSVFSSNLKQVTLQFDQHFAANTSYNLSISDLKDCAGNTLNYAPSKLRFTTPKLPPVRQDTAKLYITEIFADPSPEVGLPLAEFVEIYNPGKDTIDVEGWTLSNSKTRTTLKKTSVLPNEYLIVCASADTTEYKTLGKVAGVTPWPTLVNTSDKVILKSFKGRLVDSISYSDAWHSLPAKKQGGWTLERIDYTSVCSAAFNWSSSVDNTGGTPGKVNSINISNYDKAAFKADSLKQLTDSTLLVYFNKAADISTTPNAFKLTPGRIIRSAIFNPNAFTAVLTCDKFEANTIYQLSSLQLKDCAGNTVSSQPLTFITPRLPPLRPDTAKLYITEIFADPSPEINLPLAEFVEIFNPGKDTISLEGWSLGNTKTTSILKKAVVLPNQYIILCPAADTVQYKSFGKAIGLTPWPSLNNTSDQITLTSYTGRMADSVVYRDTWYKNGSKKAGGWSLELIDHNSICRGGQNWMASDEPGGGTPGKENSVHHLLNSLEPLKITSARVKDSVSIVLTFSRPPDTTSACSPEKYHVNNGVGKPSEVSFGLALHEAELKFDEPLSRGNTYRITASDVSDCAGKTIASPDNSIEFFHPHKISTSDILISEVLFNPRTEGSDFVEIYNNSSKVFDLKELLIATVKGMDSLVSKKLLTYASLLFQPGQYLVLTTDPDNVKKEYHTENPNAFLKLTSLPPFNSDRGSVVLLSGESRIDQLSYNEKMHFPMIKDPKGVSLERSSFKKPTNEAGNFRSAASTLGFATPGYRNSQQIKGPETSEEEVRLLSKTFSPDNDGFEDALHINYRFTDAGMVLNAAIYNDKGIIVKRLARNATLGTDGTLVWDGMTDDNERASVGVYIVYFDVFNLQGVSKKYKKACVLASRLD